MTTPRPATTRTPTGLKPTTKTTASTSEPPPSSPPAITHPSAEGWETLIGLLALLVGVASFAFGLKKPDLSTFWKTFFYVLEIVALVAGALLLGWLGVLLFLVCLLLTAAIHSVRLAMRLESILTSAAIESGRETAEMTELHDSLKRSHKAFQWLGPIKTADLIRLLAQRNRMPNEIRNMALPIAMLLAAFEPGTMESLIERFDRLLRLAGKSADEAMAVADTLTVGTQQGAASINEMLDALITFYSAPFHEKGND